MMPRYTLPRFIAGLAAGFLMAVALSLVRPPSLISSLLVGVTFVVFWIIPVERLFGEDDDVK